MGVVPAEHVAPRQKALAAPPALPPVPPGANPPVEDAPQPRLAEKVWPLSPTVGMTAVINPPYPWLPVWLSPPMPPETVRLIEVAPAGAVVVKVVEPQVGVALQTTGVEVEAPAGLDEATVATAPPTASTATASTPARVSEAARRPRG